ncbi:GGDEF domain-containing protein [Paludibacterium yongneupense]|uniref:GGDEF domain-containing protein n=1 Tax=Paludibacterium yongneupense TaxID=400061 RepID=UPI00041B9A99|nr:sensor domain-containing diguanylate cyclase [Paludibacterium yongneupense]
MTSSLPIFPEVFDTLPLGLMIVDAERHVRHWNRWLENASGLAREQVVGQRFARLFPALAPGRVGLALDAALDNGHAALISQALHGAPFDLNTAQGSSRPMQQTVRIVALTSQQGERFALLQINDVTDQVVHDEDWRRQAVELARFSRLDALTGLCNRKGFEERLEIECQRAQRSLQPLAVLIIDIDNFEAYREEMGSLAADQCQVRLARVLTGIVKRPGDLLTCFNAGAFAAILPSTIEAGAVKVAERALAAVAQLALPHPRSAVGPHITVSIGAATSVDGKETADRLRKRADAALRRAQASGRARHALAPVQLSPDGFRRLP